MNMKQRRLFLIILLAIIVVANLAIWFFNWPLIPSLVILYIAVFAALGWANKRK